MFECLKLTVIHHLASSEENELLLDISDDFLGLELHNVESHSFGEWSALSYSHDVSFLYSWEGWGAMDRFVVVSLLESVVLLDVVEIISSHDNSSLHLS